MKFQERIKSIVDEAKSEIREEEYKTIDNSHSDLLKLVALAIREGMCLALNGLDMVTYSDYARTAEKVYNQIQEIYRNYI